MAASLRDDGSAEFTLGTRVQYRHLFGGVYMGLIDHVHRRYVTPTMMRLAADYAVRHGVIAGGANESDGMPVVA